MEKMDVSGSRGGRVLKTVGEIGFGVAFGFLVAKGASAGEVGTYPNFTNYGVHGNPAVFHSSQLGQWVYLEPGKSADGTRNLDLMASMDVWKDVTVTGRLSNAVNRGKNSRLTALNLSFPVTKGVLLGGKLSSISSSDGSEKNEFAFGAVGVVEDVVRKGELVRGGLANTSSGETQVALEDREKVQILKKVIEATASGKIVVKAIRMKDGKIHAEVLDEGAGVELREGKNLVSYGRGGPGWKDIKIHGRRWINDNTFVDLHLTGRGSKVVRKPGYMGVGVTKCF